MFVQVLMKWLELDRASAEHYMIKTWIFMHGIATLVATNQLELQAGEIESLLEDASEGFLRQIKMKQGA